MIIWPGIGLFNFCCSCRCLRLQIVLVFLCFISPVVYEFLCLDALLAVIHCYYSRALLMWYKVWERGSVLVNNLVIQPQEFNLSLSVGLCPWAVTSRSLFFFFFNLPPLP